MARCRVCVCVRARTRTHTHVCAGVRGVSTSLTLTFSLAFLCLEEAKGNFLSELPTPVFHFPFLLRQQMGLIGWGGVE